MSMFEVTYNSNFREISQNGRFELHCCKFCPLLLAASLKWNLEFSVTRRQKTKVLEFGGCPKTHISPPDKIGIARFPPRLHHFPWPLTPHMGHCSQILITTDITGSNTATKSKFNQSKNHLKKINFHMMLTNQSK